MSYDKRKRALLKGAVKYRAGRELTARIVEDFLESLDCPRALTVWLLFSNSEHDQLALLEFDPLQYESIEAFRDAYCATNLLSKFKRLSLSFDREQAAFEKFEKFESLCRLTNSRFRSLHIDPKFRGPIVHLHNAIVLKIARILGDFDVEEFLSSPDWGPGASTLIKRRDASSPIKFQCETGITRDLHALFPISVLKRMYPLWADNLEKMGYPTFQVGNRVITVPKNAATDRVIAIEPGMNVFFQLSIGKMISKRLLKVGIDLSDQKRNQHLARIGSLSSELVTVDFSSASDSIAFKLVEEVLPPDWFKWMDACRSHFGSIKGNLRRWEKFSSMGNGFTFPLESLIFYCMAKACQEYHECDVHSLPVGTYGDDVILPTSAFKTFSTLAEFYGFTINVKKTHYLTNFRESCGAHFYRGVDVKPIFLKDELSNLRTIYSLANAVRLFAHRIGANLCCDARFRSVFDHLVQKVPKALRFRVPFVHGDCGFISNFDEATPKRAKHQLEGFVFPELIGGRATAQFDQIGLLLTRLWNLSKRDLRESDAFEEWRILPFLRFPILLKTTGFPVGVSTSIAQFNAIESGRDIFKLTWSKISQWPNLGPWLDLC